MKVYANKLGDTLKRQLSRVYVVSGDEPLLMQETCDLIRKALREHDVAERDLFHVEEGFNWETLLHSANSMSLFADKKLIEVRMNSKSPGDKGRAALVSLVKQLDDATTLLLVMPRIDANTQKTKWFKAIESAGILVQVWPVEGKELLRWLEQRFRREGLQVSREAVIAMAQRLEGNLLAAVQEIARLKLTTTNNQIELSQVLEDVADSARYDVFKLIDAALEGRSVRLVRMVRSLRLEGAAEMLVNVMLAREIRTLEAMSVSLAQGQSMRDLLNKARVWDKRKTAVSRCLERHDADAFRRLQLAVSKVDRMIKGIEPGDPWREMTTVLLGLAGVDLPHDVVGS